MVSSSTLLSCLCHVTWVSRGLFHWQSRTWMPQCTKVTHFSPKLSLSTSPSSAFVPTCRFCCLLGCLSLCVPVRRSVETLFSTSHHSLYLTPRQLTAARTHTHTHILIKSLCCACFSATVCQDFIKAPCYATYEKIWAFLFSSQQHLVSTTSLNARLWKAGMII